MTVWHHPEDLPENGRKIEIEWTKEEMRTDIENTQKELAAYRQIKEGYVILSGLPENNPRDFILKVMKYDNTAGRCEDFLIKLKKLYRETFLEEYQPDE